MGAGFVRYFNAILGDIFSKNRNRPKNKAFAVSGDF